MIGAIYSLLHNPNLRGVPIQLSVSLSKESINRISWTPSSIVRPDDPLVKNLDAILSFIMDPLAEYFGMPRPNFVIGFQKHQSFSYHEEEQTIEDTSAGAAIVACMLSSMLGVSLKDDIAITGAVHPPHSNINWPKNVDNKVEGCRDIKQIHTIYIPIPEEPLTSEKEMMDKLQGSGKQIDIVSNITGLLNNCFNEIDLFIKIMTRFDIYSALQSHQVPALPVIQDIVKALKGIYDNRWENAEKLIRSNNAANGKIITQAIIGFYMANKHDPGDILNSIKRLSSELPVEYSSNLFNFGQWANLSRLYKLEQYDDLLELLMLISNNLSTKPSDFPFFWENDEFRDSIREIVIESIDNKQFDQLIRILQVLERIYTADLIMPEFRQSIFETIKIKYLDDWENIYNKCCVAMSLNERSRSNIYTKEDERLEFKKSQLSEYFNLVDNALALTTKLYDLDPQLSCLLFDHSIFKAVIRIFKEAEAEFSRADANQVEKLNAINDLKLFYDLYKKITDFKMSHIDILSITEGKLELLPGSMDMAIKISNDIDKLEFEIYSSARQNLPVLNYIRLKGNNLIENPVLLWQQSDNLPNYWKADNWDIKNDVLLSIPDSGYIIEVRGENKSFRPIHALFSSGNLKIIYNDVEIFWRIEYSWPPSIDSLFFARTLAKTGYLDKKIKSIADIGTGSGFLGIFMAKKNRDINELYACDVSAKLVLLAKYNIKENLSEKIGTGFASSVTVGSGLHSLKPLAPFDLVLSAPPYLPRRDLFQTSLALESPTDGTDLLEEVIKTGRGLTKEIVMELSEIAKPEFESACKSIGAKYEKLDSMVAPLRIPSISPYKPEEFGIQPGHPTYQEMLVKYNKLKDYTDFLVSERELRPLNKRNFKYWQQISVYSITYPD